jgi:hypothetical protein
MEINLKEHQHHTIIAGKIKMQDGKILGEDGTPLKF